MKRLAVLFVAALGLTACGGGGGGGATVNAPAPTPTAAGTAVDATAFKSVFYGKVAGSQYSFNLAGSDIRPDILLFTTSSSFE